jgi:membrane-anchored protein YejM (alkaline phosphatase superfamily)
MNNKPGFLYLALSTVFLAVQFLLFIKGSSVLLSMDFTGWLFFITSCVSHAACLTLIPFLLFYLPLSALHHWKIGGALMVTVLSLVSVLIFLDMQVYDIYRFHINGFILNMVFSSGATEIFAFDTLLYLKEFGLFAIFIAVHVALWLVACRWAKLCTKRLVWTVLGVMIGATLYAHCYHIYSSFLQQPSVMKSRRLLPYYFPTTAYELMTDMGFTPPVDNGAADLGSVEGDVNYPLHPIEADTTGIRPNIVIILIDSWSTRTLTEECMPTIYHYAQANSWYKNHFSCSNGTRSSLFGMFFSVPSYYWDVFESNHQSPVFVDEMLRQGYQCQVYPSATFVNPPFHRVLFQHVKNLNTHTEGDMVYERDSQLTDNFLADLPKRVASGKPFFSLLFYDLAHSCDLPPELRTRFQPAWAYSDYTKLNNGADPMPFFNLYRNGCYQIDQNVNRVLKALEEAGIADNTIVLITGDHAQEFNENKKNYWGHNGNFSRWQIGVPLVYHHASSSNAQPAVYAHRTTHYDIVPTLMQEALGVKNDIADYSVGHQLDDPQPRSWHVVGSELNYAFIIEGDTILEKTADGSLEVTDAKLNPVDNYKLNVKEFNEAIMRLNRYMK